MRAGPTVFNYRSELRIIPLPTDWLTDSSTFLLIRSFLPRFPHLGFTSHGRMESDTGGGYLSFPFRIVQMYYPTSEGLWKEKASVSSEGKLLPATNSLQFVGPKLWAKQRLLWASSVSLPQLNVILSFSIIKEREFSTGEWAEILWAAYSASTFGKYSD